MKCRRGIDEANDKYSAARQNEPLFIRNALHLVRYECKITIRINCDGLSSHLHVT